MLHAERWAASPTGGPPAARAGRVALLHGFTQSGAAWGPLAPALAADGFDVVAPDLPGHGGSADVATDLWGAASAVADAVGPAVYVGYSMGGRVLLHLALARPEVVQGMVLVSTTAGIDDADERAARRAGDEALADRVEAEGVEAFVRWWLTLPLFATLPPEAAAIDARLGGSAAGLASSLRLAGTGTQDPLWDRLAAVEVPALVVAGALDVAYVGRARRLAGALGGVTTLRVLDGCGHACHLERPGAFAALLLAWLADHTANPAASSTPNTSTS